MLDVREQTSIESMAEVYALMKSQHFPSTPDSFEEALPFLQKVKVWGVFHEEGSLVAFIALG